MRRKEVKTGTVFAYKSKHAGLTAVSRLVDILCLSRPTILKMTGVPNSTFYSWQNNPQAIIRTPTVSRLLRLQAQVALLDEALGRKRMRDWILSSDRFDKLQGSETAFTQVLAEAEAALREVTQIKPRPRMRHDDYASQPTHRADDLRPDEPFWPGAAKIQEEPNRVALITREWRGYYFPQPEKDVTTNE